MTEHKQSLKSQHSYSIKSLSECISLALLADGVSRSGSEVASLLREAANASELQLTDENALIEPLHIFAFFADFSELLGSALGHEIEPEGFAMDWAEPYPHLMAFCTGLTQSVLSHMSGVSNKFEQVHGYTPGEVWMKSMSENVLPEVAAASLERDRKRPQIH